MRLITRSDFDGLACAVLLKKIGLIDSYLFVHPKDVQDGKIPATANDVLTNIPYIKGCGLWFDHHSSEAERLALEEAPFEGCSKPADSCARVVYEYYGGAEKFKSLDDSGLMDAVDRSDSGRLTEDEIKHPTGWMLLSFLMDARTGLGRFKDYTISNHDLMKEMIDYCLNYSIDEILAEPHVKERVVRYFEQERAYKEMILANGRMEGNVLVLDLRNVPEIQSGNRFMEYALFPQANVSVRVLWGRERKNVVFTVGHSILDRSCWRDIGSLLLEYGGGGHKKVGTCQVDAAEAERVLVEIVNTLKTRVESPVVI